MLTWKTVNFVALPAGWVSVYSGEDGEEYVPIPGVVIEKCEENGEIRAVAADFLYGSVLDAIGDETNFVGMRFIGEEAAREIDERSPKSDVK